LVNVETRRSYPLVAEQLVRDEVKETAPKAVKKKAKNGKAVDPRTAKASRIIVVYRGFFCYYPSLKAYYATG
jgi:hypothetical protein